MNLSDAIERFNVSQVRMDKGEFYSSYHGDAPSLVFLDACHSYESTRADILWARSVNANVICGHDSDGHRWPGVVKAVNECGGYSGLVDSLFVMEQHKST